MGEIVAGTDVVKPKTNMPRFINKRNITICIGIAVAILIVLSTTSFAVPSLSDTVTLKKPALPTYKINKIKQIITKTYKP